MMPNVSVPALNLNGLNLRNITGRIGPDQAMEYARGLSTLKENVSREFGDIRTAIDGLSLDNGNRALADSVFRGLIAVRNITGHIGLEQVRAYAERAAGMVHQSIRMAQDFVEIVENLPREIAALEDMVMEGFDSLAETVAGLIDSVAGPGEAAEALPGVPDTVADPATYNPALDVRPESLPPRSGVGSFGPVVFFVSEECLAVVRGVSRKAAARVEEHQVSGAKPRLEFIAPELDETSFSVFWHRGFGANPRAEIGTLRELCTQGAAKPLILGGENFGRHLLTGVDEKWLRSGPGGSPLAAEAALTFKEYL
jgi:hypothetical protein